MCVCVCVCVCFDWFSVTSETYLFWLNLGYYFGSIYIEDGCVYILQYIISDGQNQQSMDSKTLQLPKMLIIVLLVKNETPGTLTSSFCWRYRSLAAQSRSGSVASAPQKSVHLEMGKPSRLWKEALLENTWIPLAIIPRNLSSCLESFFVAGREVRGGWWEFDMALLYIDILHIELL